MPNNPSGSVLIRGKNCLLAAAVTWVVVQLFLNVIAKALIISGDPQIQPSTKPVELSNGAGAVVPWVLAFLAAVFWYVLTNQVPKTGKELKSDTDGQPETHHDVVPQEDPRVTKLREELQTQGQLLNKVRGDRKALISILIDFGLLPANLQSKPFPLDRLRYRLWYRKLFRATFLSSMTIAFFGLLGALLQTVVYTHAKSGFGGHLPIPLLFTQSLCIAIASAIFPSLIYLNSRTAEGPIQDLVDAFAIGGIGPLVSGVIFLAQLSPELIRLINDQMRGGLPLSTFYQPTPLSWLIAQRLLYPLIGMLSCIFVCLVRRAFFA